MLDCQRVTERRGLAGLVVPPDEADQGGQQGGVARHHQAGLHNTLDVEQQTAAVMVTCL